MQKGSIVSDTFEKLGELAKDSAKTVATEPLKILQQALGMEGDESPDPNEQGVSASTKQVQAQQVNSSHSLLEKKKQEDAHRVQKLLALHRQRMREEEAFFEQSSREKEQQKQLEAQEEERKEQEEIIQLERQNAKDAVLSASTAGATKGPQLPGAVKQAQKLTGTKEVGKSKGD